MAATDQDLLEDKIQKVRRQDRRFSRNAYYFVLDALDSDWPVSPMSETLVELAERRIRGMDPAYFRRMRDGIAAGLLLVYLPEERAQRLPIFGTAGRLLDRAPGGGIDLDGPGVLRLHRTRPGLEQ